MSDKYKFLIIDTYYPKFLVSLYNNFSELAKKSYVDQMGLIMEQCFGTADFYSKNLKKLGCDAEEIIPNNSILQRQWATEHGMKLGKYFPTKIANKIPFLGKLAYKYNGSLRILESQIKTAKPDILYVQDIYFCPRAFLDEMKKYVKLVVGQIACPLPPIGYLKPYDLILTSFPHFVAHFKRMGIKSEYFKIGFDPSVLEKVTKQERKYFCTFVGGISRSHKRARVLLEKLASYVDIDFFGYGAETLEKSSSIIPRHHGEVWGIEMYRILLSSKITINRHIDVAENYANNMRLYEATGCGCLLITDYKENLNELFKLGEEVVSYKSIDKLIELIRYYGENEDERKRIAEAGQRRTLNEHTYYKRMVELVNIIRQYI
jgi:spore maturation protein CgeB